LLYIASLLLNAFHLSFSSSSSIISLSVSLSILSFSFNVCLSLIPWVLPCRSQRLYRRPRSEIAFGAVPKHYCTLLDVTNPVLL
jgi:hypothetical protein